MSYTREEYDDEREKGELMNQPTRYVPDGPPPYGERVCSRCEQKMYFHRRGVCPIRKEDAA